MEKKRENYWTGNQAGMKRAKSIERLNLQERKKKRVNNKEPKC